MTSEDLPTCLTTWASHLPPAPRVALVHRRGSTAASARDDLRAAFPQAVITTHDADDPDEAVHVGLCAAGPFDVVVDAARAPGAVDRVQRMLYHLRPGGLLVVRRPGNRRFDRWLESVDRLRTEGARPPLAPRDQRPHRERDLHALAASSRVVGRVGDWLAVELVVEVLAKLPESGAGAVLAQAGLPTTATPGEPSVTWTARGRVAGSDAQRAGALPTTYHAADLSVREWPGAVSLPHGGVLWRHLVLPDTFRRRWADRARSEAVVDWSHWSVRAPDLGDDVEELSGVYLHADNEWRGHFGHALTEQVSRLWAWPRIKERFPEARWLVHARPGAPVAAWEHDLWAAGGVDPADVHVCRGPVRVERLLTATPAFSTPTHLHPALRQVWDTIGAALAANAPRRSWPERVFLSRGRSFQRSCHNRDDVERQFVARGFEVIHPEEHDLAVQAALVRHASVIAGFTGSGMYQVALAGGPRHVIGIGSEAYPGWVEPRIAALLGHRLDLVWCRSDVPLSAGNRARMKGDFTFDAEREGVFLATVLDGLDRAP